MNTGSMSLHCMLTRVAEAAPMSVGKSLESQQAGHSNFCKTQTVLSASTHPGMMSLVSKAVGQKCSKRAGWGGREH